MILRNHFQSHMGGHFTKMFDRWPGTGGETLIQEYTVTAGNILVDLTSTGMVFDSTATLDLSTYAGNDTDSTPYRMVLVDGSANEADFFVGGPGGGEALGVEKCIDPTCDNAGSWSLGSGASISGGELVLAAFGATARTTTSDTGLDIGQIIKNVFTVSAYTSGGVKSYISYDDAVQSGKDVASATGQFIFYDTQTYASGRCGFVAADVSTMSISDVSTKALTDVPTTGIHAITAQNGSTRGFTSIDAGFNPNNITAIKVYEL